MAEINAWGVCDLAGPNHRVLMKGDGASMMVDGSATSSCSGGSSARSQPRPPSSVFRRPWWIGSIQNHKYRRRYFQTDTAYPSAAPPPHGFSHPISALVLSSSAPDGRVVLRCTYQGMTSEGAPRSWLLFDSAVVDLQPGLQAAGGASLLSPSKFRWRSLRKSATRLP